VRGLDLRRILRIIFPNLVFVDKRVRRIVGMEVSAAWKLVSSNIQSLDLGLLTLLPKEEVS
jgi:hypothetical protein